VAVSTKVSAKGARPSKRSKVFEQMPKEYRVKLKRIYEAGEKRDGFRILVGRLWPRGVSKEKANIDLWLKDLAPAMGGKDRHAAFFRFG